MASRDATVTEILSLYTAGLQVGPSTSLSSLEIHVAGTRPQAIGKTANAAFGPLPPSTRERGPAQIAHEKGALLTLKKLTPGPVRSPQSAVRSPQGSGVFGNDFQAALTDSTGYKRGLKLCLLTTRVKTRSEYRSSSLQVGRGESYSGYSNRRCEYPHVDILTNKLVVL